MLASLGYDCFDEYDDCLPPGEDIALSGADTTAQGKAPRDQPGAAAAQSPQLCATSLNSEVGMLSPSGVARDMNGSVTRLSRRMDSSGWDTASISRDLSLNDSNAGEGPDGRDDEDADGADADMADADD